MEIFPSGFFVFCGGSCGGGIDGVYYRRNKTDGAPREHFLRQTALLPKELTGRPRLT